MNTKGKKEDEKDLLSRKLALLLRTGKMLIENLADSNRIDRNIRRAVLFMGIPEDRFHMHISYTTLMINISKGHNSTTRFQKCSHHGANMNMLADLSTLTWKALEDNYTLEQYETELNRIEKTPKIYPRWLTVLFVGLACGSFCKLFGCDWFAFLFTCIASSIAVFIRQELHKQQVNMYLNVAISAFIAVLIAGFSSMFPISTTPHHPIFASVLFLIPGLPIINSLKDMINGFSIVGLTRALIVFMTIGAISFGLIFAIKLLQLHEYTAILIPKSNYIEIGLAGAMAAGGFAVLFNVPTRPLFYCFLGGLLAVITRNILQYEFGVGLPISSFFGAVLVSITSVYLAHRLKIPENVIAIPSIIPMIPGVLMYKTIIGILNLDATKGEEQIQSFFQMIESGTIAGLTVLSIALGIAIPSVIGKKYFSRSVEQRMSKAIQKV